MTTSELLTQLARSGVRIEAHRGRLRFQPRDRVTADQLEGLRAHKAELLTTLAKSAAACPPCGGGDDWPGWAADPVLRRWRLVDGPVYRWRESEPGQLGQTGTVPVVP